MTTQKQILEQPESQMQQRLKISGIVGICHADSPTKDETKEEEKTRSALAAFKEREEEFERKKMEVKGRVEAQLGLVEEATKRLAVIREELEGLTDPMRKEVAVVRKRIDTVNRELKPLGLSCQKKEKEYRKALEAFNEKNKEKNQLVTKLKELVGDSEKMRMKKLEELSKSIESLRLASPANRNQTFRVL